MCELCLADYSYDIANPCKSLRGELAFDFGLLGADVDVHSKRNKKKRKEKQQHLENIKG